MEFLCNVQIIINCIRHAYIRSVSPSRQHLLFVASASPPEFVARVILLCFKIREILYIKCIYHGCSLTEKCKQVLRKNKNDKCWVRWFSTIFYESFSLFNTRHSVYTANTSVTCWVSFEELLTLFVTLLGPSHNLVPVCVYNPCCSVRN